MARRSDHSRRELYDLAVGAARRIVEEHGLRALTARKVADAIGYSPGTLYNLFENLDYMIVHLNGRTLDDLHDRLSTATRTGVPEEDLNGLLDGYLGYLEDHPNLWNMLFEHTLPDGQELPTWYAKKVSRGLGLVEDVLSPLFPEDHQDRKCDAARILWASLHGICSLYQAGKLQVVTSRSAREMAEVLVANFIAGLKVTQDTEALNAR